jgi:xylulokinase
MNRIVIGTDLGTSGAKSVALDGDGQVVASFAQAYEADRRDGGVTHDARIYEAAAAATIGACIRESEGKRVVALGITAPAHYAVLVGKDGEPIAPVLLASDSRPDQIASELRQSHGEAFFETTFAELTAGWTFPQLIWHRRSDPALWPLLRKVLIVKDYVRFRMTGEDTTDPSDAAGTALFDQRRGEWSRALVEEAALDLEQLPRIRDAISIGGGLNTTWARQLGLPIGTPVAVGATDTAAELISVGAVNEGASLVKIGSTGTVVAVSHEPRIHRSLLTYPHAVPGRWYTLAATNTAATAYSWLRQSILEASGSNPATVQEVDHLARQVMAGSDGVLFLPFLEGERSPFWEPRLRAAFMGLSSRHGRAHLARAVLEGVALSLRMCRDLMESVGFQIASPFLTGGGTTSLLWRDILVSVLGRPGYLAEPHGPAVGAALIAAAAVREPPAANGRPVADPRLEPIPVQSPWAEVYNEIFPLYVEAAHYLAGLSAR